MKGPQVKVDISRNSLMIYGAQMITSLLISIGQISEDVQESCNKYDISKDSEKIIPESVHV